MPNEKNNEEERLIDGCKNGDLSSQKRLFEKYYGLMLSICLRYTHDREEAKDILQEGFLKVFKQIETYRYKVSFFFWMKKIMVNAAIDKYRGRMNQPSKVELSEHHANRDLDQELMADLNTEDLLKLIQKLPPNCRLVFNLFVMEEYSHKEIAKELNIKEVTSRSQLDYARKLLRDKIQKLEEKENQ